MTDRTPIGRNAKRFCRSHADETHGAGWDVSNTPLQDVAMMVVAADVAVNARPKNGSATA
jgi:hypothetical protein